MRRIGGVRLHGRRPWWVLGLTVGLFLGTVASGEESGEGAAEVPAGEEAERAAERALDASGAEGERVETAARRSDPVGESPAAVHVLTGERLRRSGTRHLAEALRQVPGIQVARIDANKWVVSARGSGGRFSPKLLVLVDGRIANNPLFGGVYWDVLSTPLEDIERIEVIRGPAATLWGPGAMNGVVHIITKSARDTQGGYAEAGGGSELQGTVAGRYGGQLNGHTFYRFHGRFFSHDGFVDASNDHTDDDWDHGRAGFRFDFDRGDPDTFTLEGEIYGGTYGSEFAFASLLAPPELRFESGSRVQGGHLRGRWMHTYSESSDLALQFTYDRADRDESTVDENRDSWHLDFQHRFRLAENHDFLWGLDYRSSYDDLKESLVLGFDPAHRYTYVLGGYAQDTWTLIEERLRLIYGSRFDYNNYTRFEWQPNGRLLWTPKAGHSVWGAVSRAVRLPTRAENDAIGDLQVVPGAPPTLTQSRGNHRVTSEDLLAFEVGYRTRPSKRLRLDLTAFYNRYDNLVTLEPAGLAMQSQPVNHLLQVLAFDNEAEGEVYGAELGAEWSVLDSWTLAGALTWLKMNLRRSNSSGDTTIDDAEDESPKHTLHIGSHWDLPGRVELDGLFYWVDSLAALGVGSFTRLDLRLRWRARERVALEVVGQNLIDRHHEEFGRTDRVLASEVERGVFAIVRVSF